MPGFTERKIGIEFGQIVWPVRGLEWRSGLRLCTHSGIVARNVFPLLGP